MVNRSELCDKSGKRPIQRNGEKKTKELCSGEQTNWGGGGGGVEQSTNNKKKKKKDKGKHLEKDRDGKKKRWQTED